MERKEFEMTEEQYAFILDKPLPVMMIGGVDTRDITQTSANGRWMALGKELGFDGMTARPVAGKGERVFTAEVA